MVSSNHGCECSLSVSGDSRKGGRASNRIGQEELPPAAQELHAQDMQADHSFEMQSGVG